jgi:hypothetical protein
MNLVSDPNAGDTPDWRHTVNVDELLAREGIQYTMAIYNNEGDRGRLEGLASAFAEDGVLEAGVGEPLVGRAAIVAGLMGGVTSRRDERVGTGTKPLVRHHLTTKRIDVLSPTEAQSFTAAPTPIVGSRSMIAGCSLIARSRSTGMRPTRRW